jgi:hypothetical protein
MKNESSRLAAHSKSGNGQKVKRLPSQYAPKLNRQGVKKIHAFVTELGKMELAERVGFPPEGFPADVRMLEDPITLTAIESAIGQLTEAVEKSLTDLSHSITNAMALFQARD